MHLAQRWTFLLAVLVAVNGNTCWAQTEASFFKRVTIDSQPPGNPWFKMLGDINGDGQLDILCGGSKGPLVVYLYPHWKKQVIGERGWNGVNGEVADLDGDGDADVVMGGVVWFENPGKPGTKWQQHRIDNYRAHDIEIADVDRDGKLDVVARDQSAFGKTGNKLTIYYQQERSGWERQRFDCPHGEGLKLADIDRDGDADIVIGGRWYANPRGRNRRWRERVFTSEWKEPDTKVDTADINGDGRTDIVLTPAELKGESHAVCWYEAPEDPTAGDWKQHVVIERTECVIHALGLADFDGDGDVDIALAEMHQGRDPDEVTVQLNRDQGTAWTKLLLSSDGSHDIVVGDIDDDGDVDIVGANHSGSKSPLELWRNERRSAGKTRGKTAGTVADDGR